MTFQAPEYARITGFPDAAANPADIPATLADGAPAIYDQALVDSGNLTIDPDHTPHAGLHRLACAKTAQFGYEAGVLAARRTVHAQFVAGFSRAGMPISCDNTDEVLARYVDSAVTVYRDWREAIKSGNTDSLIFPAGLLDDFLALMAGVRQAFSFTPSPTLAELVQREHHAAATSPAVNP